MRKAIRVLLVSSVFLLGAATASFYIGHREIGHGEPAEQTGAEVSILRLEKGERWYVAAGLLGMLAAAIGLAGIKLWIHERAAASQLNVTPLTPDN